jgi:F-type H+-transporting ATPase subunit delta
MADGNHNQRFDVEREQLAKVYATALLAAANQQNAAADVVEQLDSLVADVFDPTPKFEEALNSPLIDHEDRETIIDNVFANRAHPLVLNLLKVLSLNDRIALIRSVARHARRMFDESQNRVAVNVRVAREANSATIEQVRQGVARAFGIEPQLEVSVDPDILGGIMLRIGDTVYDGSIRTALERSRRQMLDRAVEAIETSRDRFLSLSQKDETAVTE